MKIYIHSTCLIIWTISLVLASSVDLSNTFLLQTNNNLHQNDNVDVNRFTQLLSNHLLFDHFDKAYLQLSKKISFQFRDAIQVKVKKIKAKESSKSAVSSSTSSSTTAAVVVPPPVDVQILKRQLKGAVGSFVEDKLPAILTNRYNTTSLQNQLDNLLYQYCPGGVNRNEQRTISHQCLLDNRESFLLDIYSYTTFELQSTLLKINEFDLPKLFEKTRAQISGILIHFNQHTLDQNYHRLELKIKSSKTSSAALNDSSLLSLPPSYYNNNKFRNWITPEMILDFISTVTHADNEEGSTIQKFIDLSM